jgi:lipopolysaccharide/colanic/teichoic acid biosynthesis glycosyltransferase
MNTIETYPLIPASEDSVNRTAFDSGFSAFTLQKRNSKISGDSVISQLPDRQKMTAENFLSARTILLRLEEKNLSVPNVILVNLPYNRREMTNFIQWLRQSEKFRTIPVFYYSEPLSHEQLTELKHLQLADDSIEMTVSAEILLAKIKFVRKVKEFQHAEMTLSYVDKKITRNSLKCRIHCMSRRLFDIFIGSILTILLLPLFAVIAVAIKLESRGPVIYASKRAGKGFRIFKFYKFRTMYADAEAKREELEKMNLYNVNNNSARFFKIKDDPRVTKIGAFLRNTSLDELPQLFNVLKGDMSIVGNRPLPLYEASTLTTNEWAERFMAPAGITGLWQIKKRGKSEMSVEERIRLDISYAQNNNLLQDIRILAKTPSAMLQKTNV